MTTVYTFGDSILDCGSYNDHRVHPGQLIVQNHDHLFPEFRGYDLISRGPARLVHHARDGATIQSLSWQMRDLVFEDDAVALLTIGGNDLMGGYSKMMARRSPCSRRRSNASCASYRSERSCLATSTTPPLATMHVIFLASIRALGERTSGVSTTSLQRSPHAMDTSPTCTSTFSRGTHRGTPK